jgi:hypothetical protein
MTEDAWLKKNKSFFFLNILVALTKLHSFSGFHSMGTCLGMSRTRSLSCLYIWKHNGLPAASSDLGGLAVGSGNEFLVTQELRLSLYSRI